MSCPLQIFMEVTGLPLLVSTDQEGGEICRIKWLKDRYIGGKSRGGCFINFSE
jgi:hypothetical protein